MDPSTVEIQDGHECDHTLPTTGMSQHGVDDKQSNQFESQTNVLVIKSYNKYNTLTLNISYFDESQNVNVSSL